MKVVQYYHHYIQAKNKAIQKSTIVAYVGIGDESLQHNETLPQPTQISRKEMDEIREK